MKSLLYKVILLCCVGVFCCGCGGDGDKLRLGEIAKDFTLETLEHKSFSLNQYKGRVVVLVFWATYCPACKSEMAELKLLENLPNQKGFVVASVCIDPEKAEAVQQVVEMLHFEYPVLLDEGAKVFSEYKMKWLPTTIIIDQKGAISLFKEGYSPSIIKQLEAKITVLLSSNQGVR